jgi:hypothetical protein
MSMQLIETKTLGAAAASLELTSIPQDGTDLLVLISGRSSRAAGADSLFISINGSTSNFTGRYLEGSGTSVGSSTIARFVGVLPDANNTANTFSNIAVYFSNYAGSTNKSFSSDSVMETNATESYQDIIAGLWSQTTAISSLSFAGGIGNIVSGSTISLYKITKGSDGIVTTS